MELIYLSIGESIRALRKDRNMTQEQLADALGMLRSSLTQIECGNRRLQIHELLILSEIFDTPMATFLPDNIRVAQGKLKKSEQREWERQLGDKEWREYTK